PGSPPLSAGCACPPAISSSFARSISASCSGEGTSGNFPLLKSAFRASSLSCSMSCPQFCASWEELGISAYKGLYSKCDYDLSIFQMNDRLQEFTVFARAAESGRFSRAARYLNLSQPSVSRIVSALEARLGVKLLLRTTRSVTLTDAGVLFPGPARGVFGGGEGG